MCINEQLRTIIKQFTSRSKCFHARGVMRLTNIRLITTIAICMGFAFQTRAADTPAAPAGTVQRTVKLVMTMSEGANAQYIYVSPPEGGASVKLLVSGDAKK